MDWLARAFLSFSIMIPSEWMRAAVTCSDLIAKCVRDKVYLQGHLVQVRLPTLPA